MPPLPLPLVHRELALHIDASYVENQPRYELLTRCFRVAAVLLSLEVAGWILDLALKT
jgi:hypothetical protein